MLKAIRSRIWQIWKYPVIRLFAVADIITLILIGLCFVKAGIFVPTLVAWAVFCLILFFTYRNQLFRD